MAAHGTKVEEAAVGPKMNIQVREPMPTPSIEEVQRRARRPVIPSDDNVRVADVMARRQPVVPSHISMAAARKIAELKSADALIVEDKGSLMGFLDSESLRQGRDDQRVVECLKPLRPCVSPNTTVEQARELLLEYGASSLPVTVGPFLIGSVSRSAIERSVRARIAAAEPTSAHMAA